MAVAEIIGLAFYALQQLGVALGVGGQTAALFSRGNSVIATTSRRTAVWGLWIIIVSGAFITAAHLVAGEGATVWEPAYVFKWFLLAVLVVGGLMARGTWHTVLVGGTWYALFALHTLAPVTTFALLAVLYAGWMALFALTIFMLLTKGGAPHEGDHPSSFDETMLTPASATPRAPVFAAASRVSPPAGPPFPVPQKATQSTTPLSFVALAKKEPPPPRAMSAVSPPRMTSVPPLPPNLPGIPQQEPRRTSGLPQVAPAMKTMMDAASVDKGGLSAAALASIPTVLPEKDSKPLSKVSVMPRQPEDFKK